MQFAHFKIIIHDWYQDCVQQDLLQSDRLLHWRSNVDPESGKFLLQFIHASRCKAVLELGISTVFLRNRGVLWAQHCMQISCVRLEYRHARFTCQSISVIAQSDNYIFRTED